MFFSVDLLSIRKNRRGRLPACWLAGTHRNFIGRELPRLPKKQIINVNISAACDDIIEGITEKRFSLPLSSMLAYGALRIFQTQVCALEDDCLKLLGALMVPSAGPSKPSVEEWQMSEPNEKTTQQIIDLFPPREDRNLIQEVDIPRLDNFGELSFYYDVPGHPEEIRARVNTEEELDLAQLFREDDESLPLEGRLDNIIREVTSEMPPPPEEVEMAPPRTPKRKQQRPHTETPTKRQHTLHRNSHRSTESQASSIPRLQLNDQEMLLQSELASSPVAAMHGARRSLINDLNASQPMYADSAEVMIGEVPPPVARISDRAASMLGAQELYADRFSPSTENIHQMQRLNLVGQDASEVMEIVEPQDNIGAVGDGEVCRGEETTSAANVHPNIPIIHTPPTEPIPEPLESMELEEIHDLPINQQNRRRLRKRIPLFDNTKQIRMSFSVDKATRPRSQAIIEKHIKIPAKELLVTPATGLKMYSNIKSKKVCNWATPLQDIFFEALERAHQHGIEELRDRPLRRDAFVTRRHYSNLEIPSTHSSTDRSGLQTSKDVQDVVADENLMPPPPAGMQTQMSLEVLPPSTSHITDIHDDVDQDVAIQTLLPPTTPEANIMNTEELNNGINQYERQEELSLRASSEDITNFETFHDVVEKLWTVAAEITDSAQIVLDDILLPNETSVEELITCMMHLCTLEKEQILNLVQDKPYTEIKIIKK